MGNDVPGRVGLPLPGFLPEPVDVVVGFVVAGVDGAAEGACEGAAVGSAVAVGATGSGAAEDTIGAAVVVDEASGVTAGAALPEPDSAREPPPSSAMIATVSETMITPIAAPIPIQRRDEGGGRSGTLRGGPPCGARRIGAVDERAPSICGPDGGGAGTGLAIPAIGAPEVDGETP